MKGVALYLIYGTSVLAMLAGAWWLPMLLR
jgi:hypothetical protein